MSKKFSLFFGVKRGILMRQVVAELQQLNKKIDVIVEIMGKPEKMFIRILQMGGMIISLLTILNVIETIRRWLGF